jgi:hypothetical protein
MRTITKGLAIIISMSLPLLFAGSAVAGQKVEVNPCAAKVINACAAKTINACAAKTINP